MAELQIELKLSFQIPQNGLSINNLLYQLRKFMAKLFFAVLEAIFAAVEHRAIEALKTAVPGRYVRNGLRRKPRQIRTAYGLFGYRVGRVLDKETKKTFSPLWQAIGLPAYRRTMEEKHGGWDGACLSSIVQKEREGNRQSPGHGDEQKYPTQGSSTLWAANLSVA